ncbi:MAG: hypothetical protein HKL97_02590 [Acidocella sp.]|nr:hypothetical protein [Acidocella sp.]
MLEAHDFGRVLFEQIGAHLEARGIKISMGTIVEATIIAAPSSAKNASGQRDPEMHKTRKGQQWCFGMKEHVGVPRLRENCPD